MKKMAQRNKRIGHKKEEISRKQEKHNHALN